MVDKVISRLTITVMAACLFGSAIIGFAQEEAAAEGDAAEQAPAQPEGPQWKDREEYDAYQAAYGATDPAEKLKALEAWKEKYPETDYEVQRRLMYLDAYQGLQQPAELYDAALELVGMGRDTLGDPNYLRGAYLITTLTMSMQRTEAQYLANGEKYAREVLEIANGMQRPAEMAEAAWTTQIQGIKVSAQTTVGWIAMQRKNYPVAERELRTLLEMDPQNGQASYWLGTVLLAQRDPQKQFQAFWQFARAGHMTGEGAMPAANRKTVADYLADIYTKFHGDDSGLDELIQQAQQRTFSPQGFSVKSAEQIAVEKENELLRTNPDLYAWRNTKNELTGPDGMQFYQTRMNDSLVSLVGYVISQDPPERPTTLVLGLSDRTTREVTLHLDQPYRYPAARGTRLRFQAVPTSFTQEPFMLVMDAEQDNISGWPDAPPRTEE